MVLLATFTAIVLDIKYVGGPDHKAYMTDLVASVFTLTNWHVHLGDWVKNG